MDGHLWCFPLAARLHVPVWKVGGAISLMDNLRLQLLEAKAHERTAYS